MTTTPEYDRLKHDDKDGYDLNKLSTSIPKALDAVSEPVLMDGKPATAEGILYALVDIDDDATNNPPEHRCYIPSAFNDTKELARRFLSTSTQQAAEPINQPQELPMTTHIDTVLSSIDDDARKLADRIAASCAPDDGRAEIAYAIARYLKLNWPAAEQGTPS